MTAINVNRQSVLYAERSIDYTDLSGTTAKVLIYVRPGTRVLSGFLDVTTAWNNSSTGTLSIGDTYTGGGSATKYLAATDLKTAALTKFTLPPVTNGAVGVEAAIIGTPALAGTAATAGAATIGITYIETGRTTEFMTRRS